MTVNPFTTGAVLFVNNGSSTLFTAVDAISTSIRVQAGDGAKFPKPVGDGSNWFMVTLEDRRNNTVEICKCTANNNDIMTVVRGQEGTGGQAFAVGTNVSNRLTAGTMSTFFTFNGYSMAQADTKFVDAVGDTMTGPLVLPGAPTLDLQAATKKYVDDVSIDEAPTDGRAYARQNINWVPVGVGMPEAPNDGTIYGRQSLAWVASVTAANYNAHVSQNASDFASDRSRMDGIDTTNSNQDSRMSSIEAKNSSQDTLITNNTTNINTNATALATETTNRTNADTTLQTNITSEATTRANTDTSLQNQINTKVGPDAPNDGFTYGRQNNAWATIVGGAIVNDNAPTGTLQNGQMWWESDTGSLYIYYADADSSQWVMVAPGQGNTPNRIADATIDMEAYFPTGAFAVNSKVDGTGVNVLKVAKTGLMTVTAPATTDAQIILNKPASGQSDTIVGQMGGNARWSMQLGNNTAESGSNVGSDFVINRWADAGTVIDQPLTINRASGAVTAISTVNAANMTTTGVINPKGGIVAKNQANTLLFDWIGSGLGFIRAWVDGTNQGDFLSTVNSPSAAGYAKFGNGFLINWGTITTNSNGDANVGFAQAFASGPVIVIATVNTGSGVPTTSAFTVSVCNITTTTCSLQSRINNNVAGSTAVFWAAVGR
jgi:hypothetical protein